MKKIDALNLMSGGKINWIKIALISVAIGGGAFALFWTGKNIIGSFKKDGSEGSVDEAKKELEAFDINFLGALVNDCQVKQNSYKYQYGYVEKA